MKTIKALSLKHSALGVALVAALGFSGGASAAPPWCESPPCKGGPGGGEESAGNNLSLPTKFMTLTGAPTLRIACPTDHVAPGVDQTLPTFPPEAPTYWLQKTVAQWSADCAVASAGEMVEVSAKWGDNLVGDAPFIKTNKPIRVEVNLTQTNDATAYTGYLVVKLTDELDRLATYGTDGTTLRQNYRVFDANSKLTIEKCEDTSCGNAELVITEDPMSTEINSIGAVVYGYNWGVSKKKEDVPEPGVYRLTFYANDASIKSVQDAKASLCASGNCTYVIVTLTQGGGTGGGGGGNPNRP